VKLTTGAFAQLKKDPTIGRAEALRLSMQALIADRSSQQNADPSIWAPFVLVGEGG
jgi:CHAT domain-containing protein